MARTKDPKAKITYIRLTGELEEMVVAICAQFNIKKSEAVRRVLKKFKDSGLVLE